MKTFVVSVMFLCTTCSVVFGQAGVDGIWRLGEMGQPFLWEVVLKEDARQLTGAVSSCASNEGPVEIFGGKVEASHVSLSARARTDSVRSSLAARFRMRKSPSPGWAIIVRR